MCLNSSRSVQTERMKTVVPPPPQPLTSPTRVSHSPHPTSLRLLPRQILHLPGDGAAAVARVSLRGPNEGGERHDTAPWGAWCGPTRMRRRPPATALRGRGSLVGSCNSWQLAKTGSPSGKTHPSPAPTDASERVGLLVGAAAPGDKMEDYHVIYTNYA